MFIYILYNKHIVKRGVIVMTVIVPSNFKGGIGKTTTCQLFTYLLATKHNKKVLAVDSDPQGNLSYSLATTFDTELDSEKNIFKACFNDESVHENIQPVHENVDLLRGHWKMTEFEMYANKIYKKTAYNFILKNTLAPIIDDYDYIIIDTSPYMNLIMDNVIHTSDYVLISTQTAPLSFESTKKYYDYLINFYDEADFELAGVLAYLVGHSATDKKMLNKYNEVFDVEILKNQIKSSDRVKTWSLNGITEDKPYDQKTLQMYDNVLLEVLERIQNTK